MKSGVKRTTGYDIIVLVIMVILAILFIFPVYWIVTGSFKDAAAINAASPEWFPKNPTTDNYVRLFAKPAMRWLFNSVFIALMSMALTCMTAAMAGYALAKTVCRKRIAVHFPCMCYGASKTGRFGSVVKRNVFPWLA